MLLFIAGCSFSIIARGMSATVAHAVYYHLTGEGKYLPQPSISWQIDPASLHFTTTAQKTIIARVLTSITIQDESGVVVKDQFILQTPPRSSAEELADLVIAERRSYGFSRPASGMVQYTISLMDLGDSSSVFTHTDSMHVVKVSGQPFFSDVELMVYADSTGASVPLCTNFLDDPIRTLYFKTELYNLKPGVIDNDRFPLVRKVQISKRATEMYLPEYTITDTIINPASSVKAGEIPIATLASGNYYITVSLDDKMGNRITANTLFIQRMNRTPEKKEAPVVNIKEIMKDTTMEHVTVLDLDKTFISKYTIPQLKAILVMLLPLSDAMHKNTINGFLKKTDEMYMRYYIYNHFKDINPKDPGKAWKEYSAKVMEVNKKFSANGTPGYQTDRGFIYLRYGKPTDIITVTNEAGSLPYEIWQYNTLTQFGNKKELANSLFLFFKQSQNLTDYRLLHSTVPGEPMNGGWRSYLYSTTNGASAAGFNMNSRAEQYFGNR